MRFEKTTIDTTKFADECRVPMIDFEDIDIEKAIYLTYHKQSKIITCSCNNKRHAHDLDTGSLVSTCNHIEHFMNRYEFVEKEQK